MEVNEYVEAYKMVLDYITKVKNGIETVCKELNGNRQPDTDAYLRKVIEGINWIIEVYNASKEFLADNGFSIDKEGVNAICIEFSKAYKEKNDAKMSEVLSGALLTFITSFENIAAKVVA